jgi:tetratricopeptide (TPR) repeat protein
MDRDLAQEAISYALAGKWQKAVEVNLKIISGNHKDTEAMNRLSRAYAELGKLQKARKIAQEVLILDPFNTIASKSLEKWKGLKKRDALAAPPSPPETFLEEPGKTKIVSLIHLGGQKILAELDAADEVKLDTHSHRVAVNTISGKYIGRLPDDLSARIKKLTNMGNEYQAFIKCTDKTDTKIFLKEIKRAPKLSDTPSFPAEKIDYISFTPPELVHKKEERIEIEPEEE